jgi:hypothetical protein
MRRLPGKVPMLWKSGKTRKLPVNRVHRAIGSIVLTPGDATSKQQRKKDIRRPQGGQQARIRLPVQPPGGQFIFQLVIPD